MDVYAQDCATHLSCGALIFVFWGRPTVLVVMGITIVLLVLGLIELIGWPVSQPKTVST